MEQHQGDVKNLEQPVPIHWLVCSLCPCEEMWNKIKLPWKDKSWVFNWNKHILISLVLYTANTTHIQFVSSKILPSFTYLRAYHIKSATFVISYLGTVVSEVRDTALYFSSFPSNISSTSEALSSVIFVARLCWPNPTVNVHGCLI